ncbi:hypothetical protein ABID08_000742 [Rhizobium binae]|uniref:Uncharacterized protein n=1 Tax=Rhizobium binae TaxID=1138190 RepID=A0ABV2MDE1_9HYPH|nr:hypothetical protein [Rhizobium binae]MBX4992311.1 hypothetical protein [Rhizobium binae]NKL50732.1 hypothetical protein [Rhizobium leguminosarum bv. viciae]QSY80725.1 hypothetical protein J2J99_13460 [Rhizobium binae]
MGELLDRTFQHRILTALAETYPRQARLQEIFPDEPDNRLVVNVHYLHEHELLSAQFAKSMSGHVALGYATITAKGLDFLQDDGGLSAILGIVTIKIHEDTVKQLVIDQVEKSPADSGVKKKLIDQIRGLPAEGVKVMTVEAIKLGLGKAPDLIAWLSKTIT